MAGCMADPVIVPRAEHTISRKDIDPDALKVELQYFIDCILHDKMPSNDGAAGLRVVRLLEAAEQSLNARGRLVTL